MSACREAFEEALKRDAYDPSQKTAYRHWSKGWNAAIDAVLLKAVAVELPNEIGHVHGEDIEALREPT